MVLSIIVAAAENNVIGRDNGLIWRLSADLKRFKALTTGHTILMGRKSRSVGHCLTGGILLFPGIRNSRPLDAR